MATLSRRHFLQLASALGATLAWGCASLGPSHSGWSERRDLYPQGVASGDPDESSVLLWTRRPHDDGRDQATLLVEVAEDAEFRRVVATASAVVSAASDWTCRVLVGGLLPGREYWYRFVDDRGAGSRIGRTLTAPAADDPRPVRFAVVSCQSLPEGAFNAWRRMVYEDERAPAAERLGFVLHLGDFIYEVVQYPEQVAPNGKRYDRTITFPVRFPDGQKVFGGRLMAPASLADYRALYQAYLCDPDLQDARARWPFVAIWDNHEFSWQGWQSIAGFGEGPVPAQRLKVAANQAWFEYLPARVAAPGRRLDRFDAPVVEDVPVTEFDGHGLGIEPNNLAAIDSLIAYRALRWGRHLELLVTDQRSFRSQDPSTRPELAPLLAGDRLPFSPERLARQLDAGRVLDGGPPPVLRYREREIPNFRADESPQSLLGARQKAWFLDRLRKADATWKLWGSSLGTLDWRIDPQNLPKDLLDWRDGYAILAGGDWGASYVERAQIFDAVREAGITGFAVLAGDRHSFWAGYAAKDLPPAGFAPVGLSFVVGSITSPGFAEAWEFGNPDNPLRPLFVADRADGRKEHTANLALKHGVQSALEYARSGDLARAHALGNPELAPHLEFVDLAGHGYATVRVDGERMQTEFVCIPRPLQRADREDGGPLRYRLRFDAGLWKPGERPVLEQVVVEGDAGLSAPA